MNTLDMRELTQALIEKGYTSARYEMTGAYICYTCGHLCDCGVIEE